MPQQPTNTISAALHAARAVIDDNDAEAGGLVIILLREGHPVTVLRQPRGEIDLATITAAARSASAAVVIVLGTPAARGIGPILMRLDELVAQLSAAGISDPVAVHVPSLDGDQDTVVTALTNTSDRVVPALGSHRRARRRGRIAALLGGRRRPSCESRRS
ncbi:hypothetical protein [Nocardia sp. NPDC059691]|uniref:hypothetical protein n=1 Tax=Nocardia sp. NPDC059691 TaxID=3346908 RepID=UPI0036811508